MAFFFSSFLKVCKVTYHGKIHLSKFCAFLGTSADNSTFSIYADRFQSIYPSDSAVQMIYLAGDNDIGKAK